MWTQGWNCINRLWIHKQCFHVDTVLICNATSLAFVPFLGLKSSYSFFLSLEPDSNFCHSFLLHKLFLINFSSLPSESSEIIDALIRTKLRAFEHQPCWSLLQIKHVFCFSLALNWLLICPRLPHKLTFFLRFWTARGFWFVAKTQIGPFSVFYQQLVVAVISLALQDDRLNVARTTFCNWLCGNVPKLCCFFCFVF